MSARVIAFGTAFFALHGIALAARSGQLPEGSGASASSQPTCVLPLRPAWPIWQQSLAFVSAWTKSTSRFHAASCAGA
jgi:hypothetical protein